MLVNLFMIDHVLKETLKNFPKIFAKIWLYIYIYIYIYIYTHAHTYVYIYTERDTRTHTHIYVHIYVCIYLFFLAFAVKNFENSLKKNFEILSILWTPRGFLISLLWDGEIQRESVMKREREREREREIERERERERERGDKTEGKLCRESISEIVFNLERTSLEINESVYNSACLSSESFMRDATGMMKKWFYDKELY